jgi:nitrate/TMAO reductase-like tetraheme cytochrome c subunit
MTEHEPTGPDPAGREDLSSQAERSRADAGGVVWTWQNVRWFASRGAAVMGALLLLGGTLLGFSGWYTSRPEFCRSCHIMEPYYASWQHSSHNDVSCIKCHFPPGAGEKIRGKMLGLVQLIKYVTETAGPRPTAEVPDASCLRSGCHETRLLSGRLDFDGIPFDHGPHLGELRRGKQLHCTSCHSQIVQGTHMTVTATTCYLCHFKDEPFNEGLGACTRCHQIPDEELDLGGGVTFSHDLAYERGVNCANCHADLIRGNGEVPLERCTVCHNRPDDLQRIDDHQFLHERHVTDHNVDCLACHLTIHHSLDEHPLLSAVSDCAACHPRHHTEQVQMLAGVGAKTVHPGIGGMTSVRIACDSCHRSKERSATGAVLWSASMESCASCHDPETADRLRLYHATLQSSLADLEAKFAEVRGAAAAADLPDDRQTEIRRQLDDLQHDLDFLRAGNGIHNIHYADTLTRALVDQLSAVCRELELDEPQITLPEKEEWTEL